MKESYKNYDGFTIPGAPVLAFVFVGVIHFGGGFYALIPGLIIVALVGAFNFTEIDFNKRRYREGTNFLGRKSGEWKTIRAFKYVSIVGKEFRMHHIKFIGTSTLRTGTNEGFGVYEIRLFNTISQRHSPFQFFYT